MAVTFTQAQIDAFAAAIVERQGAQSISFGDQQMTFESSDKARAFLAFMERNISTGASAGRMRLAATSKGV